MEPTDLWDATDRCPECGGELAARQKGSTLTVFCQLCPWCVATTNIPAIRTDMTKYEIRITGGDVHKKEHIKTVAAIAVVNFLEARKLLQEKEPVIFAGRAVKVAEARDALRAVGIACSITPEFRY